MDTDTAHPEALRAHAEAYLTRLGLNFKTYTHRAVFTTDEAEQVNVPATFIDNKNLFLRNKNGTQHTLVSLPAAKRLNLKALQAHLGSTKLSFASPERLLKYLGLTPGSVSPFGLMNDAENTVRYIIDSELMDSPQLGFHPNTNTATTVLSQPDFTTYLNACGSAWEALALV